MFGSVADETIYRAQSVEDLLSHEKFTIVSPGIEYRNKGAGYYNGYYTYAVTLPSGERVAARINGDSVQNMGKDIFSGDNILPIGKVVYEDLTKDEYFIGQIEYSEKLSRTDFYIDMLGNAAKLSKDDYASGPMFFVQLGTIIIVFALVHTIGSKLGIFPYFFAPKKKQEAEWK